MTRLLINIDHIATLRNARREAFPDPMKAAEACESAGADGIVFHLREDRRHIQDDDVRRLKESVRGKLDFELSTARDIVRICCETVPDLATLVPERREEITTEGGIDAIGRQRELTATVTRLREAGIAEIALFIDPDSDQIEAAASTGADAIEIHTGAYANAHSQEEAGELLGRMADAADRAHDLGLAVHAGHGLDYDNIARFLGAMPHLEEVSIGFAVVARSLMVGLPKAVHEMKELLA